VAVAEVVVVEAAAQGAAAVADAEAAIWPAVREIVAHHDRTAFVEAAEAVAIPAATAAGVIDAAAATGARKN